MTIPVKLLEKFIVYNHFNYIVVLIWFFPSIECSKTRSANKSWKKDFKMAMYWPLKILNWVVDIELSLIARPILVDFYNNHPDSWMAAKIPQAMNPLLCATHPLSQWSKQRRGRRLLITESDFPNLCQSLLRFITNQ